MLQQESALRVRCMVIRRVYPSGSLALTALQLSCDTLGLNHKKRYWADEWWG